MVGIVVVNHNSIVGLGKAKLTPGNSDDADVVWGALFVGTPVPVGLAGLGARICAHDVHFGVLAPQRSFANPSVCWEKLRKQGCNRNCL